MRSAQGTVNILLYFISIEDCEIKFYSTLNSIWIALNSPVESIFLLHWLDNSKTSSLLLFFATSDSGSSFDEQRSLSSPIPSWFLTWSKFCDSWSRSCCWCKRSLIKNIFGIFLYLISYFFSHGSYFQHNFLKIFALLLFSYFFQLVFLFQYVFEALVLFYPFCFLQFHFFYLKSISKIIFFKRFLFLNYFFFSTFVKYRQKHVFTRRKFGKNWSGKMREQLRKKKWET